jgi:hypothetical protein
MPALCNRGLGTLRDVTRAAVAMERWGKHDSAETNSRNNRRAVFLWGSCRGVMKDEGNLLAYRNWCCQKN